VSTAHDRGQDIVDLLIHDHREVEEALAEFEAGDLDAHGRRQLADTLIAELVQHAVEEEQYLYPAIRQLLPGGDRIADHEIRDHAEAERDMKALESLEPTDPRFDVVLTKLAAEMRQHILEEEVDLFPRLRIAADPETLRELGRKAQAIKKIAPTHPHPSAPAQLPVSRLLMPALGLVDRIRDALRS
jgi:iron-sulfur cluster repair protein YtfE (RIC family)